MAITKTQILPASDTQALAHAVRLLRAGRVIAFPTDTVYGVGANGFDERAVEQLFDAKNRARDKALPLLLAHTRELQRVAREIPPIAQLLAKNFWPGALTIVLFAKANVPRIVTAGGETVAVRVPNHPTARALIDAFGAPLAATSANISGAPDPQTAQQVFAQLNGRIPLILDHGATRGNMPSTVIDVTVEPPRVVRVGAMRVEELERVLGMKIASM